MKYNQRNKSYFTERQIIKMANQKRISDYVKIGNLPTGKYNKITDVKGVKVGHTTIKNDVSYTGVTVILPTEKNLFTHKLPAATFVLNGFGKSAGLIQIDELGTLEAPIALTNTLNVGKVLDGMMDYVIDQCEKDGVDLRSINIPVLECNDSEINNIRLRAVEQKHVKEAIENVCEDFDEGDVGAGTGTKCHGFKGGIGSASRIMDINGDKYTLGVLIQTNYGHVEDLRIDGHKVGLKLQEKIESQKVTENGSVIVVVATDAPLSSRQLKRALKRVAVGLIRDGSYTSHGSGEVFLGFSTANEIVTSDDYYHSATYLKDDHMNYVFKAVGEAVEEAVLNSMINSNAVKTLKGPILPALKDYIDDIKDDIRN